MSKKIDEFSVPLAKWLFNLWLNNRAIKRTIMTMNRFAKKKFTVTNTR